MVTIVAIFNSDQFKLMKHFACQLSDVADTQGFEVEIDDQSIVLFRRNNQLKAYYNQCPHQGRLLNWAPGQFLFSKTGDLVCAAHGATFDIISGECIAGPCMGAMLKELAIEVVDNQVFVIMG